MARVFVLLLLILACSNHVLAAGPPASCRIYTGTEIQVPDEIRNILSSSKAAAIEACVGARQSSIRYSWISAHERGPFGICFYRTRALFQHTPAGPWTFTPPAGQEYLATQALYMAVEQGECPSFGDERYVVANEISVGLFINLTAFWKKISMSDSALVAALAPIAQLDDNEFRKFMAAMREQRLDAPPKLRQVSLWVSGNLPFYSLEITSRSDAWGLIVDMAMGGEVVVVGFGRRVP